MLEQEKAAQFLAWELQELKRIAEQITTCKRKPVGCGLYTLFKSRFKRVSVGINGASCSKIECTNEIGNCGCAHAEPKAILDALKQNNRRGLVMVCTYSPCVPCANLIIQSELLIGLVRDVFTVYPKADYNVKTPGISTVSQILSSPNYDMRGEDFIKKFGIPVLTKTDLLELNDSTSAIIHKWLN